MKISFEEEDIQNIATTVAEIIIEKLNGNFPKKKEDDPFLTVDELAGYLKVKKNWIYQKVHSRDIPYHKIGKQLRFRKSEIDADL